MKVCVCESVCESVSAKKRLCACEQAYLLNNQLFSTLLLLLASLPPVLPLLHLEGEGRGEREELTLQSLTLPSSPLDLRLLPLEEEDEGRG